MSRQRGSWWLARLSQLHLDTPTRPSHSCCIFSTLTLHTRLYNQHPSHRHTDTKTHSSVPLYPEPWMIAHVIIPFFNCHSPFISTPHVWLAWPLLCLIVLYISNMHGFMHTLALVNTIFQLIHTRLVYFLTFVNLWSSLESLLRLSGLVEMNRKQMAQVEKWESQRAW